VEITDVENVGGDRIMLHY